MSKVKAIKTYFGKKRPVTFEELKALSKEERDELYEGIPQDEKE